MQNKTLSIDCFDYAEAATIRTRTIAVVRVVPKLVLLLLVLGFVAVTNAAYVIDSKAYPVKESAVTWHDPSRQRDVPVNIYAPDPAATNGKKFPVVVFSPGFGESRYSYKSIGRYLARNGYITVVVDHIGSDTDAYNAKGWAAMADTAGYRLRPEDISFAIDRITASDQSSPLLHNRVDASGIGVAGHSLGSTTALSMVGLSVNLPGQSDVKFSDPRVAAAVALSPQVDSTRGLNRKGLLDKGSWDGIDRPVLLMTGTLDYGISRATRSDPNSRHVVFERLSGVDAYYMNIENAAHHAFTDTKPFYPGGPRDPRHHKWIGVAVTAFFDAYLRNDADALAWLQSDGISKYTNGEVHQEQKSGGRVPRKAAAPAAPSSYDFEPLTAFIDNGLRETHVQGAGMLVIDRSGHVFYEKMFGDWTEDKAVPIASASKWWAAATVMTLVDKGLIALDDPVSKYLPEFRNKGSKSRITLRQTLSFTSGYAHHERIQDDPSLTQAQLVRRISGMDLLKEPGTAFIYGGMQMEIAGRVAEVVTGKPYREVFEEQLLRPLGATSTRIGNMVNRRPSNMDFESENPLVPGGVVTNLTDYRKFILMLLNDGVYNGKRILSPEAVREMTRDQTNGVPIVRTVQEDDSYRYSLGAWYRVVDAATGEAIVSSGGAFGTSPWLDLKGKYGVVFITMARAGQLREFVWRLKDTVTDIMDHRTVTVSFSQASAEPRTPAPAAGVERFFRRLDKNNDQQLERDEIPARMQRLNQAFDRLDRDHNGRLSVEEFGVVAEFAGRHSTHDRAGTAAERPALPARGASAPSAGLALADDAYRAVDSGLAIAVKEKLVLHDEQRDKDVQMRITYPRSGGPYPVIVFSHYSGGTKEEYAPLIGYWASHGYVCIQPDHSDSPEVGGKRGREALRDWKNRPLDISFIIDSLPEIGRRVHGLAERMDVTKIGVGGHYLGAYTANLIGGMKPAAGGESVDLKDTRVSAVVALSPQGTGQGLTPESWRSLTMPMLVMTGSGDYSSRTGNSPQWRTEPYQYSPSGDKYLVFVEGLTADYGGIVDRKGKHDAGSSSADARLGYTQVSTTAFWDAYLKGSEPAREFLRSGELETASGGAIKLSWK